MLGRLHLSEAILSNSSFKNSRFESILVNEETTLFEVDFEGADLYDFKDKGNSSELIANVLSKAKSLYKSKLSDDVKKTIILTAKSPNTLRQLLLDRMSLEALGDEEEYNEEISEEKHLENFPNIDYIKAYQSITKDSLETRKTLHDWLQKKISALEDRLALYPSLPELNRSELDIFLDSLIQEIDEMKKRHAQT